MKKSRLAPLIVSLALLLPLDTSVADDSHSSLEECKIKNVEISNPLRVGWPKFPGLIRPEGSPSFLVVGVDFEDAPMSALETNLIRSSLQLDRITDRYKYVSEGKFSPAFEVYPHWVRMPEQSSHYGQSRNQIEFIDDEWTTHHIMHDLMLLLKDSVNFKKYSGVIILVPGGKALSGTAAYATVLDKSLANEFSEGVQNYIVVGGSLISQGEVNPWQVIVHEINHLLGLPDLYLYETDGDWKAKTPGPFGQQAFVYESSSDSLAWNRWLNSWIPDEQVTCLDKVEDVFTQFMSPPNDSDPAGSQLLLIPLNESKVLAIESLNPKGYVGVTYFNSLLVYTVDTSIKIGEGPVRIIPRPTLLTLAPLTPSLPDWKRFVEAPLIPGSYLEYEDFLIVNEAQEKNGSRLTIYRGKSAIDKKRELEQPNKKEIASEENSDPLPQKKTILCVKGKTKKRVTAISPKCPKGFVFTRVLSSRDK